MAEARLPVAREQPVGERSTGHRGDRAHDEELDLRVAGEREPHTEEGQCLDCPPERLAYLGGPDVHLTGFVVHSSTVCTRRSPFHCP